MRSKKDPAIGSYTFRGSGAYDHIKELLEKKFIVKRKQKDGRSYWLSLSEKFFQTFAVSNEYLQI